MTMPWEVKYRQATSSSLPATDNNVQDKKPWEIKYKIPQQPDMRFVGTEPLDTSGQDHSGQYYVFQSKTGQKHRVQADTPEQAYQTLAKFPAPAKDENQKAENTSSTSDDFLRGLSDGVNFGFSKNIWGGEVGAWTGLKAMWPWSDTKFSDVPKAYAKARDEYGKWDNDAKERSPYLYGTGQFGGVVGSAILPGASGLSLTGRGTSAGRALAASAGGGAKAQAAAGFLGGAAATAPEMAGLSALYAVGHGQDPKKAAIDGAIAGPLFYGAGSAVGPALSKAAGIFNKKPVIPTLEAVKDRASQLYKIADDAGVIYTPQATRSILENAKRNLYERAYEPQLQPRVGPVLNRLEQAAETNNTLKGMEQLRKIAVNAMEGANPSEKAMLSNIVRQIDDRVINPVAEDVIGQSQQATNALTEARKLWSQSSKAKDVENAISSADLRAASTGSGGNLDNAVRQNLRRILEKRSGWTPDERAALETAVRGSSMQNVLRLIGKFSPQGNALASFAGVGGTMVNPYFGVFPLAGTAAKSAADRMTAKNTQKLMDIILGGGNKSAIKKTPNRLQQALENWDSSLRFGVGLSGATAVDRK